MVDNKITGPCAITQKSTTPAQAGSSSGSLTGSSKLGQKEFLTLLVTQLQNQDPLNPMDNQQFAVQLAQFSSLEQLIDIDKKLGAGGTGSAASLATFLGTEVALKDGQVKVAGGKGSNLLVDVPAGAQGGRVDLMDKAGAVVGSVDLADLQPGKQVIKLDGLNVPDGSYDVRAVVVNAEGKFSDLPAKVTGTVEGFVVTPEPALLVGGEHVALADVTEVYAGQK